MTLEDEIMALLAKAEPLRCLPDDEPAKRPLTAMVDQINALRAKQAGQAHAAIETPEEGADPAVESALADIALQPVELPARRPGRPRKVD